MRGDDARDAEKGQRKDRRPIDEEEGIRGVARGCRDDVVHGGCELVATVK